LFVCGCLVVLSPVVAAEEPAGAAVTTEAAAEGSPEWLIQSFFKRKEWPELRQYYTTEMGRNYARVPHPGAAYWKPEYTIAPREIYRTDDSRVFAVTIKQEGKPDESNFYVSLKREAEGWKFSRARVRMVPPQAMQAMAMTLATRERPPASELWDLQRLRSFQWNDTQVKAYFEKNRAELDAAIAQLLSARATGVIHGATRASGVDKVAWQKLHDLGLYYVDIQPQGWIECALARVGESAVGFLWVHERAERPVPTEKLTVVEHLDGPWYLFRQI
jgi:hypothetical protein